MKKPPKGSARSSGAESRMNEWGGVARAGAKDAGRKKLPKKAKPSPRSTEPSPSSRATAAKPTSKAAAAKPVKGTKRSVAASPPSPPIGAKAPARPPSTAPTRSATQRQVKEPPHVERLTGQLSLADGQWSLQIEGSRGPAVRVLVEWPKPKKLVGRVLVFDVVRQGKNPAKVTPLAAQPVRLLARQPDRRLPAGISVERSQRDRDKRLDELLMHARLHRVKTEQPTSAAAVKKPTSRNVARTCPRCKKHRPSMDYTYATSRICDICLNSAKDKSLWTVGSAGSPGLGKKR